MIQIKRIYSDPSAHDGVRILLDRVWPRGLSKHNHKGQPAKDRDDDAVIGVPAKVRAARDERKRN